MRGLGAVLILLATAAAAQDSFPGVDDEILIYGEEAVIIPGTDTPLDAEEQAGFDDFAARATYFGAFAVNTGPQSYFSWVFGYSSPDGAVEAAYRGCIGDAAPGETCVIFARVEPKGYLPRLGKVTVLGGDAVRTFREFVRHPTDPGKHTAMAISAIADGWGWNYPSAGAAEGGAVTACEEASAKALGQLGPSAQSALRAGGYNQCRMIALRSPGGP